MAAYRILSIDGGGIRGILPAFWLCKLQEQLDQPLGKYFDLVAGTSIGGILACGISLGKSPKEFLDLLTLRGREVFPAPASRRWNRVLRTFADGLSAPKYSPDGLKRVLTDVFHETKASALQIKPTMVMSYDIFNRKATVWKNTKPKYASIPIVDICTAAAAAPTYFPAHVVTVDGVPTPFVDGGVVANNPTACAIAEGLRVNQDCRAKNQPFVELQDFVVVSLGCGQSTRPITPEEGKEWGAIEWAVPIIDVLFDGSADSADYIASQMIEDSKYFRFQRELDKAYDDLDDASSTNIQALLNMASSYIEEKKGKDSLARAVGLLNTTLGH